MNKTDFMRWFNSGFWKAFTNSTFPIVLPKTLAEKLQLLDSVFDEIESARYAPGIPEAGTTEIARRKDAQGFANNRKAAKEGGAVAGDARKALEAKSGKPVVSKKSYLASPVAAMLKDADTATPPAKCKAAIRSKKANEDLP